MSLWAIIMASLVSTTTMFSRPITDTSLPLPWIMQFLLSWITTSPLVTLPLASFALTSHSDDQQPTSLQPAVSGTTQARWVFSITE
ncbi:hypothetical protein D3C84_911860 [compost metagenome]